MANELASVRKPAVAERRAAVVPRMSRIAAAAGPMSVARTLQSRLGNQGTQAFAARVAAQSSAPGIAATGGGAVGAMSVSQPGDAHEREAESVAHAVMRMPDPELQFQNDSLVSAATSTAFVQRLCAECDEELSKDSHITNLTNENSVGQLQRLESSAGAAQVSPSVVANIHAMQGGGSHLPTATRAFFEPRFGADFSHVRIHTGARAEETAKSINAKAFTAGSDVAFAGGQYAPESHEGQRLLAHELTHVVQQGGSSALVQAMPLQVQRYSWDEFVGDVETVGQAASSGASSGASAVSEAVAGGASAVGEAVAGGASAVGQAVAGGASAVGQAVAGGAKSAAGSVGQTVASAGSDLLAFEEKLAKFKASLKDYSPLPGGLVRLKDEMLAEKSRLSALGESLNTQVTAQLPEQVANSIPLAAAGGGGAGAGGEDDDNFGTSAGGCGLCYAKKGGVGPREAGTAAHRVIQNMMITTNPAVRAELPLGGGRIDLALVRPELKQIEIGEIKPANSGGVEAGIKQIEARLRVLPTLAKYAGYDPVQLKYPVRQPLLFDTGAPFCIEQPKDCVGQSLSVAGPVGGLYLYFCDPSYSELLAKGCKCKCKDEEQVPLPIGAKEREAAKDRGKEREKELRPVEINWAKVSTIALIVAMIAALIAIVVCAFFGTASIVGIPVAAACAVLGLATATALSAMLLKMRNEPDTTA